MTGPAPILVTGGAGFIGSHLVERLLAEENPVVVVDDFSTGTPSNLAATAKNPLLKVIQARVSECGELSSIVRSSQFVYHLAAAVGVDLVVQSPVRTIETNLNETTCILEAAAPAGIPVLLASTSEVYGRSVRDAFSEDDDLQIGPPTCARWSYACSKLMDEFLALAFARERGLPVIIARLFNTVGPRQTGRYGMVLPRFIESALAGKPLRVFGDGRQTRCFCAVQDTVEVLCRLRKTPAARGEIVNVGALNETTIRSLAELVILTLNSRSTIVHVPYAEAYSPGFDDMMRRRPVLEKCERLTGFIPSTALSEIVTQTALGVRGGS